MASIREIRPGSWRVEWREGGRGSKKHYRFFKTEEEARAFVADPTGMGIGAVGTRIGLPSFIAELSRGKPTPKFSDYARELIASADLRPNSRKMYMTALRRVEREAIAEKPLGEIKAADMRALFLDLKRNRDNVHRLLGRVFTAAVRDGIIKVSPLNQAGIRLSKPKGKTKQQRIRALTADQVEALARAAGNDRDALCIRLGAYTGLRAGEVGGLRVEDVDFEDCRIYVRRNAQRAEGGGVYVGDPKTESSERNLKVPCSLVEDIARYGETHQSLADGTIFYTAQGNPVTWQALSRATVNAAKATGLYRKDEDGRQWPTFHKLRNTCASLLIAARMEPKAIQTYLGHASIRMTYDLYGDLFPRADEPLADTMEALRTAAERKALPSGEASEELTEAAS